MSCCAIEPCGRRDEMFGGPGMVRSSKTKLFSCYVCYALPVLFPPLAQCSGLVPLPVKTKGAPVEYVRCRFYGGHSGKCGPPREATREEQAGLKDSKKPVPLAPHEEERPGASLAFKKRQREGPHRSNV